MGLVLPVALKDTAGPNERFRNIFDCISDHVVTSSPTSLLGNIFDVAFQPTLQRCEDDLFITTHHCEQ